MARTVDGWLDMQLRQAREMYIRDIPCPSYDDLAQATGATVASIKTAALRDDWKSLRADFEQQLIADLRKDLAPTYVEKGKILIDSMIEMKLHLIEKAEDVINNYQFKNPQELIDAIGSLSAVIAKDINMLQPVQVAKSSNPTNPAVGEAAIPMSLPGQPTALIALIHRGTQSAEHIIEAIRSDESPREGSFHAFYSNTIEHNSADADMALPDDVTGTDTQL